MVAGHTLLKILSTFLAQLFTASILVAVVTISLTSRLVDLVRGLHILLNTGSTRELYVTGRLGDEIVFGKIVRQCIRILLMSRTRSGDTQCPRKG